jgi:hypothetical protein
MKQPMHTPHDDKLVKKCLQNIYILVLEEM